MSQALLFVAVTATWRSIRFSPYMRGAIASINASRNNVIELAGIERIYMHKRTGEIRIYSRADFSDARVTIGGQVHIMHSRGRFGRLYVGLPGVIKA